MARNVCSITHCHSAMPASLPCCKHNPISGHCAPAPYTLVAWDFLSVYTHNASLFLNAFCILRLLTGQGISWLSVVCLSSFCLSASLSLWHSVFLCLSPSLSLSLDLFTNYPSFNYTDSCSPYMYLQYATFHYHNAFS